jgi:hypothetical protein
LPVVQLPVVSLERVGEGKLALKFELTNSVEGDHPVANKPRNYPVRLESMYGNRAYVRAKS